MPRRPRPIAAIAVTALLAVPRLLPAQEHLPPKPVETFLANHCYDCHDDSVSKGGLNLLDLPFDLSDEAAFNKWTYVFDRVRHGEMPPKKKELPKEEALRSFLKSLKEPLIERDRKDKLENGRVQVRRLTRREYEHTMHDLLGTDLPLMEVLPEDPATHGFETVASGQQLSHHNLGRYLEAADLALSDAFNRVTDGDKDFAVDVTPKKLTGDGGNFRGPELRDGKSIAWTVSLQFYGRMSKTRVPASGWYRVTLKDLHAINPKNGVVWGTLRSGVCASNAPMLYPVGIVEATAEKRDLTFDAWIRRGHMLELKPNDATLKRTPAGASGGAVSYRGRDLEKSGFQGIAVSGIRIERIYPNATRQELWGKLFPGMTKDDNAALKDEAKRPAVLEKVINAFAARAFRRPVTKDQTAPYVQLALDTLKKPGTRPRDALRSAYRAILCSPRFLTLVEQPGRLDDHALASRLSYALWNSMPDRPLRKLADEGKLKDWKVFNSQVKRLLDDPKSGRFIESFTDQWLNLKEIDFTAPDRRLYKTFDSVVQESMLNETRQFVRELIKNDAPVQNLVHSNFTVLNERLARFYGMDDVDLKPGGGLQKVALEKNPRGGLITHGSVLKVTANGTTTSPVVRGVWVAERILGLHIPPPPANVPAIEPDIRGAVSIRDQLEKHRNSESCASCHRTIDPGGFALENFDPVGLWRTKYSTRKNAAKVDPSGITPDGQAFENISQWKKHYAQNPEMLTEGFVKQLITYATGAEPRFSDRESIAQIVERSAERKFGLRSIIHTTFASDLFKMK